MMTRRARGDGGVFKRRGKWVAKIRYTRPGDERPNQGVIERRFQRQREAIEALPELRKLAQKRSATVPGGIINEERTFGEWGREWHQTRVDLRRIADSTARNEARAISRLISGIEHKNRRAAGLGSLRLEQITVHVVDRLFAEIESVWIDEPGSRHQTRQHLFSVLSKCLQDAKLDSGNPCGAANRPSRPAGDRIDRQVDLFTEEEMHSIIKAREDQFGVLFSTLLLTGCRIGEALALQWSNIDFKASSIMIEASLSEAKGAPTRKAPKSRRSRAISVPQILRNQLLGLRSQRGLLAQPESFVFATALGMPLRQSNVMRREWFPTLDRLSIRRRGFHICRHTHASRLLSDGVPITDVTMRLGHATPAVTMTIYAHALPSGDEATARVVDRWADALSP